MIRPDSPPRIAILTVSDGVAASSREDRSGDAIADWAEASGYTLVERHVVPDATDAISGALERWADSGAVDVVLTTGGTGFTERDVTPEATLGVVERDAPGVSEALRAAGAEQTPFAWLSRGRAGIRSSTLIVNLPGSTGGVRDGIVVLDELVDHAVALLRGVATDHEGG